MSRALASEWAQVQPNLVASGICFLAGLAWAHRHIKALHRKLDLQHAQTTLRLRHREGGHDEPTRQP